MAKDTHLRTERLVVLLTKHERERFYDYMLRQRERSESAMARKLILSALDIEDEGARQDAAEANR